MLRVFNYIFETGNVPNSWKISILKVIPKKEANVTFKTIRPLQLTDCDYKIYADIFASRLVLILQHLINIFQSGGLPGRNVQESLLFLHLLIHYYAIKEQHGYLVCNISPNKMFKILKIC